jgi:hypothetical protein
MLRGRGIETKSAFRAIAQIVEVTLRRKPHPTRTHDSPGRRVTRVLLRRVNVSFYICFHSAGRRD